MPLRPITSTPDHPRSRGVYDLGVGTKGIGSGSSPLARGLLSTHAPPRPEPGIIPARAGFTIQIVSQDGLTRDHPRSRGVYQATLRCDVAYGGSSPLARGLQHGLRLARVLLGIIPARAGFTLADPWNPNDESPYQTAFTFTADLALAPQSSDSAAVAQRSTRPPSEA